MAHVNRLHNARVLVFGGTSGIGFGVANMALSNGAFVTISGSTQDKVDRKVDELRSFYPNLLASHVSGQACDLSDLQSLEANLTALFDKVTENGTNKLDHIAFCAGDALYMPKITELTAEGAFDGFKVRWLSTGLIGKLLATGKYMPQSASSSFTVTSGTNTTKPGVGWSLGASWGAACEAISRGLAVELNPIRVNCVSPGAIQTPLFQQFVDAVGVEVAEKAKASYSLLGTWGNVEDIAEAYGWFMKDQYATGTLANCDGGRILAG